MLELNKKEEKLFSEEERENIIGLGEALRSIHDRLVCDGYFLPSGKRWNIFKCTEQKRESGRDPKKIV